MTMDMAAILGLVCLLGYFFTVWFLVGIDPPKGAIVPRYHPPEKISPAAARFLFRMGYDTRCLTAAIVNLGVRDWLTLRENGPVFSLRRGPGTDTHALAGEEVKLARQLFATRKRLRFKTLNRQIITRLLRSQEQILNRAYETTHFRTNRRHWFPGILILVLATLGIAATSDSPTAVLFMMAWLVIWSAGLLVLGRLVKSAWKRTAARGGSTASLPPALIVTVIAIPFFAGEGIAALELSRLTSPLIVGLIITMTLVLLTFYHLLKSPTLLGRKVMDKLEGFRLYLSGAKDNQLAYLNAPDLTPELFEAYLPYAIALGVEKEWATLFSAMPGPSPAAALTWFQSRSDQAPDPISASDRLGDELTHAISAAASTSRLRPRNRRPGSRPRRGR